ncbi:MAG: DUF4258 domain-containing protein [Ignavibacteriaceae bacterium]
MPVQVNFHPHSLERMSERGVTHEEVVETIIKGEEIPAKFERRGYR